MNRHESDDFGFDLGPSILTMPYILKNYSNIAKTNVRLRYNQAVATSMA